MSQLLPQEDVPMNAEELEKFKQLLAAYDQALRLQRMRERTIETYRPLRQESCPLGLIHPPGGLTDDHENDLWPRCAGASASAIEPTKPGERG